MENSNVTISTELTSKLNAYKLELENFDKLSGLCSSSNRVERANKNRARLAIKFRIELKQELGSINNIVKYLNNNF